MIDLLVIGIDDGYRVSPRERFEVDEQILNRVFARQRLCVASFICYHPVSFFSWCPRPRFLDVCEIQPLPLHLSPIGRGDAIDEIGIIVENLIADGARHQIIIKSVPS